MVGHQVLARCFFWHGGSTGYGGSDSVQRLLGDGDMCPALSRRAVLVRVLHVDLGDVHPTNWAPATVAAFGVDAIINVGVDGFFRGHRVARVAVEAESRCKVRLR